MSIRMGYGLVALALVVAACSARFTIEGRGAGWSTECYGPGKMIVYSEVYSRPRPNVAVRESRPSFVMKEGAIWCR